MFEAILANATRICEAKFGALYLSDGAEFRTVALHGAPPALAEARRREPVIRPAPKTALGRAVAIKETVQIGLTQTEANARAWPFSFELRSVSPARMDRASAELKCRIASISIAQR